MSFTQTLGEENYPPFLFTFRPSGDVLRKLLYLFQTQCFTFKDNGATSRVISRAPNYLSNISH